MSNETVSISSQDLPLWKRTLDAATTPLIFLLHPAVYGLVTYYALDATSLISLATAIFTGFSALVGLIFGAFYIGFLEKAKEQNKENPHLTAFLQELLTLTFLVVLAGIAAGIGIGSYELAENGFGLSGLALEATAILTMVVSTYILIGIVLYSIGRSSEDKPVTTPQSTNTFTTGPMREPEDDDKLTSDNGKQPLLNQGPGYTQKGRSNDDDPTEGSAFRPEI